MIRLLGPLRSSLSLDSWGTQVFFGSFLPCHWPATNCYRLKFMCEYWPLNEKDNWRCKYRSMSTRRSLKISLSTHVWDLLSTLPQIVPSLPVCVFVSTWIALAHRRLDRPSLLEALEAVDTIYQADFCSQKMILSLVNRGLADGGVSIRDLISLLTVSYFSTPLSF